MPIAALLFLAAPVFAEDGNDGLELALRTAATRNPSVLSRKAALESMGFYVEEAKARRLPSASMPLESMTDRDNNGIVRVEQPLWAFGKIDNAISAARRRLEVGRLSLIVVQRQVLEDTAAAYINLYGARMRLKEAERNVVDHETLHQKIVRRQQGGIASDADVRLAFSRLIQAMANRDALQGTVERYSNDIKALTQIGVPANKPVDSAFVDFAQEEADQLVENEAHVLLKRVELEAVTAKVAAQNSDLMPTISARYERDVNPSQSYTRSNGGPDRVGIALVGSLEGLGLVASNRVKAGDAEIATARKDVDDALNLARRRIANVINERATQKGLIEAQEESVRAMEGTLESFSRQYDAGRKSWMDLLNIQRELHDARQNLVQIRMSWMDLSLRLAAISGRLDHFASITNRSKAVEE